MSGRQILVIAAHPDDELLGCGGTLALHAQQGDEITALIACEGESLRYGAGACGMSDHTRQACRTLGISKVRELSFPDQRLDQLTLTDLITPLERTIRELRPSVIYCQYGGDINRDHELLFKATLVATRPTEDYIGAVYAFDTASSTEWAYPCTFVPDTWIDISATLDTKLAAMACYRTEVRTYPHPRSLEALRFRAKAWGNRCCLDAAEVFMTVWRVMRNGSTPL